MSGVGTPGKCEGCGQTRETITLELCPSVKQLLASFAASFGLTPEALAATYLVGVLDGDLVPTDDDSVSDWRGPAAPPTSTS
jgi:hypothetical protein